MPLIRWMEDRARKTRKQELHRAKLLQADVDFLAKMAVRMKARNKVRVLK